jgi:hypothetical protein
MRWKPCKPPYTEFDVSDTGVLRYRKTGNVWNLKRRLHPGTGIIVPVCWHRNGRYHRHSICLAKAVMEAFHPNRPKDSCVHFKDWNRSNISLSNMEWRTREWVLQNRPNRTRDYRPRKPYLTQKQYNSVFTLHKRGFSQVKIGKMLNRTNGSISKILSGKVGLRGDF